MLAHQTTPETAFINADLAIDALPDLVEIAKDGLIRAKALRLWLEAGNQIVLPHGESASEYL